MNSLPLTAWAMALGAVLLYGISLGAGETPTSVLGVGPATVASLLVIGIPSTAVAYAIHFGLLERLGPVRANLVAYVVPVFAALLGWLLLGAGISALTVAGFLVVVAASRWWSGTHYAVRSAGSGATGCPSLRRNERPSRHAPVTIR